MKKERIVILLGILVALVFFYFGLTEWMKSRQPGVEPPPLVVRPSPKQEPPKQPEATPEKAPPTPKEEAPQEQPKVEVKDKIAQKIREEKEQEKKKEALEPKAQAKVEAGEIKKQEKPQLKPIPGEFKTYVVQVGAFKDRANADKAANKAKSMGYKVQILEEDGFYKVRVVVNTSNINSEIAKLRTAFGSAIIKR